MLIQKSPLNFYRPRRFTTVPIPIPYPYPWECRWESLYPWDPCCAVRQKNWLLRKHRAGCHR